MDINVFQPFDKSKPERKRTKTIPIIYSNADWERQYPDNLRDDDERSPAEIDRSRIIHSLAFRYLQGKTQIFGIAHDDFFRTRLTHSLEVAQIAKGIALIAGANTELVEAISLAHDIGHPPFGHTGEKTLNACMSRHGFGHFESNAQNLRTLARLEMKRPEYPGLNLTRATLDGLLKHKDYPEKKDCPYYYQSESELVRWITVQAPSPDKLSFETQIVDWADQVAYSVHDLEDGIHAQYITSARLSDQCIRDTIINNLKDQYNEDLLKQGYHQIHQEVRLIEDTGNTRHRAAARKQLTSRLIHRFVTAVRIKVSANAEARTRYSVNLHIVPDEVVYAAILKAIAALLIVRDQRIATLERRSRLIVSHLFEELRRSDALDLYPEEFRILFAEAKTDERERARIACDYIAHMTDNYAEKLFQRLYMPGSGSIFDIL
jgi:dGTPase